MESDLFSKMPPEIKEKTLMLSINHAVAIIAMYKVTKIPVEIWHKLLYYGTIDRIKEKGL